MKKIVYLVQGAKENVMKFTHLKSDSSDLITLTYDEDIKAPELTWLTNIFLPKSTWAEGRNAQIKYALNCATEYTYFIFLDDDVSIVKGSYIEFENLLLQHKPAVGIPLCDAIKSSHRYVRGLEIQHPVAMDQLMQAYHRSVVGEGRAVPFVTQFDHLSWWYSCEINQYLILRYYRGHVMQFNTIEIHNGKHNWNPAEKTSTVKNSTYLGGITKDGLQKIKEYIESKYGAQPRLVNTLFHDPHLPRLLFLPGTREMIISILLLTIKFKIGRLLGLMAGLLTYFPRMYYHKMFNKNNLINPYEVKGRIQE